MKKNILALSILAICASGSVSAYEVVNNDTTKLSVGGRAEARYQTTKKVKGGDKVKSNASRARLNLVGEQKINDDFSAFGKFEVEFKPNSDGQKNRAMIAGIKGDFGSISFGRNEPTVGLKLARGLSDIGPHQVEDTRNKPVTLDKWAASQFTYKYSSDMFDVNAIYALEDESATAKNGLNAGKAYAMSAKWKSDFGLSVGAGYGMGKLDEGKYNGISAREGKDYEANVTYLGAQYKLDAFTLGATWHKSGKDSKEKGYELAGKYVLDAWSFGAAYSYAEDKIGTKETKKDDKVVSLSTAYQFSPSFKAFVGISANSSKKDKQLSKPKQHVRFGVKYSF